MYDDINNEPEEEPKKEINLQDPYFNIDLEERIKSEFFNSNYGTGGRSISSGSSSSSSSTHVNTEKFVLLDLNTKLKLMTSVLSLSEEERSSETISSLLNTGMNVKDEWCNEISRLVKNLTLNETEEEKEKEESKDIKESAADDLAQSIIDIYSKESSPIDKANKTIQLHNRIEDAYEFSNNNTSNNNNLYETQKMFKIKTIPKTSILSVKEATERMARRAEEERKRAAQLQKEQQLQQQQLLSPTMSSSSTLTNSNSSSSISGSYGGSGGSFSVKRTMGLTKSKPFHERASQQPSSPPQRFVAKIMSAEEVKAAAAAEEEQKRKKEEAERAEREKIQREKQQREAERQAQREAKERDKAQKALEKERRRKEKELQQEQERQAILTGINNLKRKHETVNTPSNSNNNGLLVSANGSGVTGVITSSVNGIPTSDEKVKHKKSRLSDVVPSSGLQSELKDGSYQGLEIKMVALSSPTQLSAQSSMTTTIPPVQLQQATATPTMLQTPTMTTATTATTITSLGSPTGINTGVINPNSNVNVGIMAPVGGVNVVNANNGGSSVVAAQYSSYQQQQPLQTALQQQQQQQDPQRQLLIQQQQQQQQQLNAMLQKLHLQILMDPVNCLTPTDYKLIVKFMLRDFSDKEEGDIKKILLNKETKTFPNGNVYTEETYFEMNYAKGTWRKFAKRPKTAVSSTNPAPFPSI